jgi:hypothetical protein
LPGINLGSNVIADPDLDNTGDIYNSNLRIFLFFFLFLDKKKLLQVRSF